MPAPPGRFDAPLNTGEAAPATLSPASRTPSGLSTNACMEVNVGGRVFKASASTLRKSPFLSSLISDELHDDLRDADGRLFIDRDPDLFHEVLSLLRGYEPRADLGKNSWTAVKLEADFYQIPVELLQGPVEVVLPPDILVVRHLYTYPGQPSTEPLKAEEICMYSLNDLPPDLKTQIRIDSVLVNRHQCGSKTVFVVGRLVLSEAGFCDRGDGVWERTERKCYHRKNGMQLVIPRHPMEVDREDHPHYLCITYVVPLVGAVISTASGGVVGVQGCRR